MNDIFHAEPELRQIIGPANIIYNTAQQILLVIERDQDRPWKKLGQYFVPAGKKKPHEDMAHARGREIEEETGLKPELFTGNFTERGNILLQAENNYVDMTIFQYQEKFDSDILTKHQRFFDREIIQRAFFDIKEVLEFDTSMIRPGLYEIMYLSLGGEVDDEILDGKLNDKIYIENGEYRKADLKRIKEIKWKIRHQLT